MVSFPSKKRLIDWIVFHRPATKHPNRMDDFFENILADLKTFAGVFGVIDG
jgi:hypothetical protein